MKWCHVSKWSSLVLAVVLSSPAWALTAGSCYKAPEDQKRAEVARVLGNIGRQPGCQVLRSADYYYRALNAMLRQETAARELQFSQALGLVATAAGEDWCPGR